MHHIKSPTEHICVLLVLRARGGWTLDWTRFLTVMFQFLVGVKLLVASVTAVLTESWEVLAFHMAKRWEHPGVNHTTELALEFSLIFSTRYMFYVLVKVRRPDHWPSSAFSSTCAALASQSLLLFCVLQYSQNIEYLLDFWAGFIQN